MVSAIDPTKPRDGVAAKKSDLRANLMAAKTEIEELQIRKIENGMSFDMKGSRLTGSVLGRYAEIIVRPTIDGGRLVVDLASGNVFDVKLTEHVLSVQLLNLPPASQAVSAVIFITQDEDGGWGFAWPGAVRWHRGEAPSLSTSPNTTDIYGLVTVNGGSTWFGFVCGQMFR